MVSDISRQIGDNNEQAKMALTAEVLASLTNVFSQAIREAARMAAESATMTGASGQSNPSFSINEYCSSDGATVKDYFKRFE